MNLASLADLSRKIDEITGFVGLLADGLGHKTVGCAVQVSSLHGPRPEIWVVLDQVPVEDRGKVCAIVQSAADFLAMRKFETIDMWASRYLVAHVIDSWPRGRLTGV